jgi:hypothetical protein
MPLPDPSVSFSFHSKNDDGTYTLYVKFENVSKYRFFVTYPRIKTYELFNNNEFPAGGLVTIGPGAYNFYLFYGPILDGPIDFTELQNKCLFNEPGCKFVQESVYVDPTNNSILIGRAAFDKMIELMDARYPLMNARYEDPTHVHSGGRKSRKSRKHRNRKSRNRKHCNRKSRKHCNRKSRRR